MTRRVAILGTRYPDFSVEQDLLTPFDIDLAAGDGATEEAIIATAGASEVILAGSRPRFTARVLENLSCRVIVRYGVGVDSVDLAAADRLGIAVAYVPDYATETVAVHTVALALAALRRIPHADRLVKSGAWNLADLRPLHLPSALTAGVVGFGRIGRRVAAMLDSIGFRISAFDPYPVESEVLLIGLDELLAGSDLVTLHAPGAADGTPLLDGAALAGMRPGSILINTARGSLIDLPALVDGLRAGRPALAALDVFPAEPFDPAGLRDVSDRVILTPHMAWYTEESELDMRRRAAGEAARALRGEPLLHPVSTGGGH